MSTTETRPELGLAAALVRMSHLVQHMFADVGREHDITPQQAQLLCALISGPVGMTELSRVLHLEKSSLSGLVDRVERRGLLARVREARDRRACQVALTDEGIRLAVETHDDLTRRLDALAADLPEPGKAVLTSAITHLLTRQAAPR
jgi:DNA-binding MarR family transcriptional regulator